MATLGMLKAVSSVVLQASLHVEYCAKVVGRLRRMRSLKAVKGDRRQFHLSTSLCEDANASMILTIKKGNFVRASWARAVRGAFVSRQKSLPHSRACNFEVQLKFVAPATKLSKQSKARYF
jgi:hypothetical protein